MRLLIDMQGAQAENAHRGIGRYSTALVEAIARNHGEHQIDLLINGNLVETAVAIRQNFSTCSFSVRIHTFFPLEHSHVPGASTPWRAAASELVRESVIAGLAPDAVLLTSVFEGFRNDAVTSIHRFEEGVPTAVVLYDLIPLLYSDIYLDQPAMKTWYQEKLGHVGRADLVLAISNSSRNDAIDRLHMPPTTVVNISSAVDSVFTPGVPSVEAARELRETYGLHRPYLLYTGGIDERKNVEGLIAAYAALSPALRAIHQLVIVCAIDDASLHRLTLYSHDVGLDHHEVIFTGFVPDDHLLLFYQLATAFVFPSWYEGFGLPVLEAMACGRAVIGANASSIAEIIGRADALFEPRDSPGLTAALTRVLCDKDFRTDLETWGLQRAREFSWELTARRAIAALEGAAGHPTLHKTPGSRPRLAYVSPLPPMPSGISDYSAQLLPELARTYDIDLIVPDGFDPTPTSGCRVHTATWLIEHQSEFERVVYQFGNSEFHQHMFDLLDEVPGIVVLHDFFLSSVIPHMEFTANRPGLWASALYESHGYAAALERFTCADTADVVWKYPVNLRVLQRAEAVIVHSEHARRLADDWFGAGAAVTWNVIPLVRAPIDASPESRRAARGRLGIGESEFVVCSFGMTGDQKLNHRLVRAFASSSLGRDPTNRLLFVGEDIGGWYGDQLAKLIAEIDELGQIQRTGRVDIGTFRDHLLAADVAVQLRTKTRGETSAAVLDCMNAGVAVVVNANGAQAELPSEAVHMLDDDFLDDDLVLALDTLRRGESLRQRMATQAARFVHENNNPASCSASYVKVIESVVASALATRRGFVNAAKSIDQGSPADLDIGDLAASYASSRPAQPGNRQLLVDVSELTARDAKTGIQRVTKNVLRALVEQPPLGFRIEPVYATEAHGYRYARSFVKEFLEMPSSVGDDDPIEYRCDDIFLGLDLQPQIVGRHAAFFQRLRAAGVSVHFVVYDLLPVLMPDVFHPGAHGVYTLWLSVVANADGALCISESVADDLREWVHRHAPDRSARLAITSFKLGADFSSSNPTRGYPADAVDVLTSLAARPSFLTVGTVEPRKSHAQVLGGFERLWRSGVDINLVIVGKPGWMVGDLIQTLDSHSEARHRLHWIRGASDEYLESVYGFSSCLIAASLAEGFGLPIIEASAYGLPIIARDIPVFRELAGERPLYFSGDQPDAIEKVVRQWLEARSVGSNAGAERIPALSWRESTDQLLSLLQVQLVSATR